LQCQLVKSLGDHRDGIGHGDRGDRRREFRSVR
jgi:hypothetical protein